MIPITDDPRFHLPILGWEVHYSDRVITDAEMEWDDLPEDDVQVVVCLHDRGRRTLITGEDEYRLGSTTKTLYGKWMDAETFEAMRASIVRGEPWP